VCSSDLDPAGKIPHGQWSSPAYGVMGGVPQAVFPGGDGWCYSYEPKTGKLLWKFDLNPKGSIWELGGRGTRNNIIATPVIYDNKVFLCVGQDPEHGEGVGHLFAIDATKRGDITETGKVWHFGGDDYNRSMSTVAIKDGLLYAADLSGFLNCLDVKTGKPIWNMRLAGGQYWATPVAIDNHLYVINYDGKVQVVKIGDDAAAKGIHYMDAPLGRTPSHGREGKLNIMGAGDQSDFARAKPVLDDLGENVFHVGPLGAGHTLKLINNFFAMTTAMAMSEAFAMADLAGLKRETLYEVMSAGPLKSGMMDFLKAYAVDGEIALAFSVANAGKDVGYYAKMADDFGVPSQMSNAAKNTLEIGRAHV